MYVAARHVFGTRASLSLSIGEGRKEGRKRGRGEYKLSGGWMVLNIESCSDGQTDGLSWKEGKEDERKRERGQERRRKGAIAEEEEEATAGRKREGGERERGASSHWGR